MVQAPVPDSFPWHLMVRTGTTLFIDGTCRLRYTRSSVPDEVTSPIGEVKRKHLAPVGHFGQRDLAAFHQPQFPCGSWFILKAEVMVVFALGGRIVHRASCITHSLHRGQPRTIYVPSFVYLLYSHTPVNLRCTAAWQAFKYSSLIN